MQLVLDTNGLTLRKRNGAFWVVAKEGRRQISPHRVSSIAVTADCLMSSAAVRLAAQHGIPIYFFDGAGRARARLWSPQFGSIATIRREQVLFALEVAATRWIIDLFHKKAAQQVLTLKYLRRRKHNTRQATILLKLIEELPISIDAMNGVGSQVINRCRQSLMGIEGGIARRYWQGVSTSLPKEWRFAGRSRRPASDPFNAALNYLYGMLYNTVGSASLAAGLDTHLGYLHVDQYGKPAFVFDLIEPFRPWVDLGLVKACLDKRLQRSFFDDNEQACTLNAAGRRFIISFFNELMQERVSFEGRRLRRKNHIYRFAGSFAQMLLARAPLAGSESSENFPDLPG